MEKRNCVTSLICAAIFAFFLFQCNSLSVAAAYWPRIICIVGLVLSGLEILLECIKWSRNTDNQAKLWVLTPQQTKNSIILLCLLILWIAGLTTIGFLVCSAAALCAISIVFEPTKSKKKIIRNLIVCVIFAVIFYSLFKFLGIHFPKALLM